MKKCILLLLISVLVGCEPNPLDVDLSGIKTENVTVFRLEQDLFALNDSNFEKGNQTLSLKYGSFYERYLINPLKLNGSKDSAARASILAFTNDREIHEAYQEVQTMYPNEKINALAKEVDECVKRFRYHFPLQKIPTRLITCTTGWNYAFAYTDNALVVGLDMYLGDKSKFYHMLAYPQYQTRKMNEAHLLPDIARGWLLTEFDNTNPVNTLLNHTIFYGKLYYAVNALLPQTPDSLIIGYTSAQMRYCEEYEKKLWGYFAEKNRLYENDLKTVRELTSEGPFTGAIHKDCPPRIAMWIGWQIVKSYMENNKEVGLEELMNQPDAQKILSKSKYRP